VHIDITELEKPVGANIGSRLMISEEPYDNLQEIVERYIVPCNRHLREASNHIKFVACSNVEELEVMLKAEKTEDPNKIPYKITCLPQYPQFLVLGYIPKKELVKEYIKVSLRLIIKFFF
jgi:transcription elongation factor SPT6